MFELTTVFVVVLLLLVYLYYQLCVNRVDQRIPAPVPTLPFIGTLYQAIWVKKGNSYKKELYEQGIRYCKQYKRHGIMKMFFGFKPFVIVFKPELAEAVLKDVHCLGKSSDYDLLRCWLGDGLITSGLRAWKRNRKLLTPAFHPQVITGFVPTVNKYSMAFVRQMQQHENDKWFNVRPFLIDASLRIITETVIAVPASSIDNDYKPYLDGVRHVLRIFGYRVFHPLFRFDIFFKQSPLGKRFEQAVRNMHWLTMLAIENAKKRRIEEPEVEKKTRKSFMDLILDINQETKALSLTDVREQVDTILFAAHDAIAIVFMWWSLLIGKHQDVQQKAYEEVIRVCGTDVEEEISLDQLSEMPYLECTLKEALRLYPPAPFLGRVPSKDIEVGGYKIPKGCTIGIAVYIMQRNADTFTNPNDFIPERFLGVPLGDKIWRAYAPFSQGPRGCMGPRFAYMAMKMFVAHWLRAYRITSRDRAEDVEKHVGLNQSPKREVILKLTRR